ncbi:unnamed protein product [Miscanthus lutarioriparius]|uniref:Pentatricopeptide repeat-containing protein n=1 Tax=Miscanthus lutarioriparius TaxID=422564 RepID=A0A811SJ61_9POAL|nr:unnamed protein product [Miscanthus lutarioriparius]
MPHRDVVSATAAIGALTRRGRHRDALALFSQVLADGVAPNEFTFGTVLRSATALRAPRVGVQLHACAAKLGLCSNVFVGSALLDHYAKMGAMREARGALDDTCDPNVVSYTALITGLLKNGMFDEADRLFRRMPERNVVSWNAMIGGCSQAGLRALGVGRSVHASAIKFLGKLDVYIGNSLVSFYARCGSLEDSVLAFKKMNRKNVVSWNALICGYAQNGKGEEALDAYRLMRAMGLKPDNVTLLGLLFGCNHAGLVDEGYALFKTAEMEQPGILKPEHYACVVDLLSRAKRFDDAKRFLEELPLSQALGSGRLWREIKEKGLKRITGCSWIEVQDKVHVFSNGDFRHHQSDEIYSMLEACFYSMEDEHDYSIV